MTITFVSNFINHHQVPLCSFLERQDGVDFRFVQTEPMTEERVRGGWAMEEDAFRWCMLYDAEKEACETRFLESDIVLLGWSSLPEELIARRLSSGKITLRISERIYREGQWKMISPRGLRVKYREHLRYRDKPVYLLCAGAYVASDFHLIGAYRDKMLRWGYFPETRPLPEDRGGPERRETLRICWAGRLVALKHPEFAVRVADTLHRRGLRFHMEIVGDGPLREALETMAAEYALQENICFRRSLSFAEVRRVMERDDIFLFTSNYLEGWGAVVNEAMNAGCAVVASAEAGSVPFLIRHGENGLTYEGGSYEAFERQVVRLAEDAALGKLLGQAAYRTIAEQWNAEEAGRRLLRLCEDLTAGKGLVPEPDDGPLSAAPPLKAPGILRTLQEKNKLE